MSLPADTPGDLLLDEAASALLMADPSDLSALAEVPVHLSRAAEAFEADGDPASAALARAAAALLSGPVGDDPGGLLSALSLAVGDTQACRAGPRVPVPAGYVAPPPAAAPEVPQGFDPEMVGLIGEFLGEAGEGLATADELLLALEQEGQDTERVNALFRVFHTIKGVAGFLGLTDIATLAHATENLLNLAREGKAALEGANLEAIFDATSLMRKCLDEVRRAVESDTPMEQVPGADSVLGELHACYDAATGAAPAPKRAAAPVTEPKPEPEREADPEPVAAFEPPPVRAAPAPEPRRAAPAPEPEPDHGDAEPAEPTAAPARADAPRNGPARLRETLKIDLERVDALMEMIGELIIVESMVVYSPEIQGISSLPVRKHLTQLSKISRDLQDVAMRMRMVPVRSAFQKMQRLVRELSHKTGKRVTLALSGEGTEMDRSMVERIEDPLVHMLRNALDHGIEAAGDRLRAGKPAEATIRLSAFYEGGSVVIEVADDGRGLDRDAILRRAHERGVVREGEPLSDQEIHALIFAPGFSTAEKVTEISGRGVGMDVVKRTVEDLRGRVSISTTPGKGTTFRMLLPLTLAIIDGMLVACGGERYIVPSLSIVESLRPRPGMISTYRLSEELIDVRGELLPLFHLGRIFSIPDATDDPCRALVMVVESVGRKVGLLVDDVVAQQQVVIKPMGAAVRQQDAFSGAAILSDGRVGLILNIDRICNAVGVRARRAGWGEAQA